MPFPRRYLLSILGPQILVSVPLALLFLAQVGQFSTSEWLRVTLLAVVVFGIAAAAFWRLMTPSLRQVDEAVTADQWVAEALSSVLARTHRLMLLLWAVGGALFALIGTLIISRTLLEFAYFAVTVLIAATPAMGWTYFVAKQMLARRAAGAHNVRYIGRKFPIARKISVVFIGFFIVTMLALVLLISSRISTTLETLAINSSRDRFERVFESASLSRVVDATTLQTLKDYLPADHALVRVPAAGEPIGAGGADEAARRLDERELGLVRRIRSGDSANFIAPHVMLFRELPDKSILVMTIPWAPYRHIPLQVSFYTLIVALITSAIFALATVFLSRDVTEPLRTLMDTTSEMASGNFESSASVFADDEMGSLAESFDENRQNLRRLIARIGGSGVTITAGVRVITGGSEALLARAREQTELTRESAAAVSNVRNGSESVLQAAETVADLTQDVSARSVQLQASSEEVARSMDYLFQSVDKTSSSITQMDASARGMSQRTETLAGIGEEVLSFVAEMDSTVEELRRSATTTAELSRQVQNDATDGGEAVNATLEGIAVARDTTEQTASALEELQRRVGQISQILNVIEEITERTNLLSLNAAIIAAQAGEHGAGFTVVADEIRLLAERTRGSTKEISGIIKAVQGGTRDAAASMREGVKRVTENLQLARVASGSLTKIVDSASRSYEMANKIAASLQEQAQASRHLHEVTSRMSDNIAEINRATTEQASGTQMLSVEAERVREIALQVKNSTEQQSLAGRGISMAMEQIAADMITIRDLLQQQMRDTARIGDASSMLLHIAQENDALALNFNESASNIVRSGQEFEEEVRRFKIAER